MSPLFEFASSILKGVDSVGLGLDFEPVGEICEQLASKLLYVVLEGKRVDGDYSPAVLIGSSAVLVVTFVAVVAVEFKRWRARRDMVY